MQLEDERLTVDGTTRPNCDRSSDRGPDRSHLTSEIEHRPRAEDVLFLSTLVGQQSVSVQDYIQWLSPDGFMFTISSYWPLIKDGLICNVTWYFWSSADIEHRPRAEDELFLSTLVGQQSVSVQDYIQWLSPDGFMFTISSYWALIKDGLICNVTWYFRSSADIEHRPRAEDVLFLSTLVGQQSVSVQDYIQWLSPDGFMFTISSYWPLIKDGQICTVTWYFRSSADIEHGPRAEGVLFLSTLVGQQSVSVQDYIQWLSPDGFMFTISSYWPLIKDGQICTVTWYFRSSADIEHGPRAEGVLFLSTLVGQQSVSVQDYIQWLSPDGFMFTISSYWPLIKDGQICTVTWYFRSSADIEHGPRAEGVLFLSTLVGQQSVSVQDYIQWLSPDGFMFTISSYWPLIKDGQICTVTWYFRSSADIEHGPRLKTKIGGVYFVENFNKVRENRRDATLPQRKYASPHYAMVREHCTRGDVTLMKDETDTHAYETIGRDNYRPGMHRTVVYEHLPSQAASTPKVLKTRIKLCLASSAFYSVDEFLALNWETTR
ncbi:hypothetical protein J6590_045268 [Homalodisca vitripennis]|nr:hypothetical protein J6590_045268 [Homalodisca vitripennis]